MKRGFRLLWVTGFLFAWILGCGLPSFLRPQPDTPLPSGRETTLPNAPSLTAASQQPLPAIPGDQATLQAPAQGSAPYTQLAYTPWEDPNEKAFSLEVPQGWSISGGMFHPSPVQPKAVVEAISPDGMTGVVLGDKEYPSFVYGDAITSSGFKEGDLYSPNGAAGFVVMRYRSAQDFAQYYAANRWGKSCGGFQMGESAPLPDLSQQLTRMESRMDAGGVQTQVEVGQALFTCSQQGRTMQGYFLAKIKSQNAVQGGIEGTLWWLDGAFGFLSPVGQEEQAVAVLKHMTETARVDPEWLARQLQITSEIAREVTRNNQEINRIISESWRETTCGWGWWWRCTPTP